MHVVHGTWIPDAGGAFVRSGGFYLWVETDAAVEPAAPRTGGAEARGQSGGEARLHPRHLRGGVLDGFIDERLGTGLGTGSPTSAHRAPARVADSLCVFLLPTAADAPLPSFELLPYAADAYPETFDLCAWTVECRRLPRLIASLNEIHFAALRGAEEYQLGADFLFWHAFTRAVRDLIARDQYLPSLKYRRLPPAAKRRGRPATERFELYAGWELLSDAYDLAIRDFAAAMPPVCAAGSAASTGERTPSPPTLFAPEPLLRHFAECLLEDVVADTPFTAAFAHQVSDTLLADCLNPPRSCQPPVEADGSGEDALETYRQWTEWRKVLASAQTTAAFTLGFRLVDAPADAPDSWQVQFLVAARDDPSFQVNLADYWRLPEKQRTAVQRRLGPDFEKRLLLAFGHAARIYPAIWSGLGTPHPDGFQLDLAQAFEFLRDTAWVLEDAGFAVLVPAWWTPVGRRRAKVRLSTALRASPRKSTAAATRSSRFGLDAVVDFQYQVALDGQPLTNAEWQQLVNAKTPLVHLRGGWMELDRDHLLQMLDFWRTRQAEGAELTLADLVRVGAEADDDVEWDHAPSVDEMLAKVHDKSALTPVEVLPNLRGTLRDYQRRGVAWLRYLESLGLNPCLADDMGLGKTIQVIARLVDERNQAADAAPVPPTLLIAPTSVLTNWRKEIERFAPGLRTLVHQGSGRVREERPFRDAALAHDVVITSFSLARLDQQLLRGVRWQRVVVDEAQNIKNPQAAQTRAITKLPATHRMALTGTPVENRLLDLWSIFHFLQPGYLGTETQFRKRFETPIQKEQDATRATTLKRLVEPFILRRLKTDRHIIDDLPDKVEQKMYCGLTREQASLYEAVVQDVQATLDTAEGMARRGLMLTTLMKLKQICNHPAQFLQDGSSFSPERSYKLARLDEMLDEAVQNGDSALVFTQFTEVGAALAKHLGRDLGYTTYYLHGGTSASQREQMVTAFQDPDSGPAIFILSLRAGGVGLNLTRANHVFHFDRWWNPAVEDQATDRAFRIGQRKNVFVHKFLTTGTLEERIDEMIEDKKRVSSGIIGTDESWLTELDNESFKQLIALQRSAIVE